MLQSIEQNKFLLKELRKKHKQTTKSSVSMIVPTNKDKYIDNIFKNYAISNYPIKELIIILNNNKLHLKKFNLEASKYTNVKIFQLDEKYTLGECLNFGIKKASYECIAKMDDDDYYGPNYLTDLMNIFNYTDAQVTGKTSIFVYFEENNTLYINDYKKLIGSTFLFKKEIFPKIKFPSLNLNEDYHFLRDCIKSGIKMYSADKFNYVYIRHCNLKDHTWRIKALEYIETHHLKKVTITKDFNSIVTI